MQSNVILFKRVQQRVSDSLTSIESLERVSGKKTPIFKLKNAVATNLELRVQRDHLNLDISSKVFPARFIEGLMYVIGGASFVHSEHSSEEYSCRFRVQMRSRPVTELMKDIQVLISVITKENSNAR